LAMGVGGTVVLSLCLLWNFDDSWPFVLYIVHSVMCTVYIGLLCTAYCVLCTLLCWVLDCVMRTVYCAALPNVLSLYCVVLCYHMHWVLDCDPRLTAAGTQFVAPVIPYTAVASAGMLNVFVMRWNEVSEGVAITDKDGRQVL
jgi:hypothetical protein